MPDHIDPTLTHAETVPAADLADAAETETWTEDTGPALWIHTGWWSYCPVIARLTWPDGRVAYRVIVITTNPSTRQLISTPTTYWWQPTAMRHAARHTGVGGIGAAQLSYPTRDPRSQA